MKKEYFKGTLSLIKLALRRDRIKLPAWLAGLTLTTGLVTATYSAIPDQEMKETVIMASENAVVRMLVSPVSGYSLGEFTIFRMSIIFAILFALMSLQIVIRHTRENEETGCYEMLRSTVVGRYSALTAALIVAAGANIVLNFLMALAFIVNGLPVAGSLAAGASFAFIGIASAGVAAVTSQVAESARGASGIAWGFLGFAFLMTAIGNMIGEVNEGGLGFTSEWPVWLSPFGWAQQIYPFNQNNWWILILFAGLFVLLAGCAFILVNHRDVGKGLLPTSQGPAEAPKSLLSPLGLAWRLQKGLLLGWAIPVLIFGVIMGAIGDDYGEILADVEMAEQFFRSTEFLIYSFIGIFAGVIAIYTVQSLLKMRTEEANGTLEGVMATAVSKPKWMLSHIICSMAGTTALLLLLGLSMALGAGSSLSEIGDILKITLAQLPAILVIAGLVITLFGIIPKMVKTLSWITVLIGLVAGPYFAPLFDLSERVQNISPYTHLPFMPEEITTTPLVVLMVIAVGLTIIGLVSFNKRNLYLKT